MSSFTTFDLLALGMILTCIVMSAMRGLASELISFGGWLVSLIFARALCVSVGDSLLPNMQPRELATVCAFVLVFIVMQLLMHFLRYTLNRFINFAKLTYLNRALGALVGGLKGLFLVSLAVLVCSFSTIPQKEYWQNAKTSLFFENMAKFAIPYLPSFLGEQVVFPERAGVEGTSAFENNQANPNSAPQKKRKSSP